MDATKGAHINLMPAVHSYFILSHGEATNPKAEVHEGTAISVVFAAAKESS